MVASTVGETVLATMEGDGEPWRLGSGGCVQAGVRAGVRAGVQDALITDRGIIRVCSVAHEGRGERVQEATCRHVQGRRSKGDQLLAMAPHMTTAGGCMCQVACVEDAVLRLSRRVICVVWLSSVISATAVSVI